MSEVLQMFRISCLIISLSLLSHSARAEVWLADAMQAVMGTAEKSADGLLLSPNATGHVLIEIPVEQLSLDQHPRVRLDFNAAPPMQVYLIWRNSSDESRLHQFKHLPMGDPAPVIDMSENPDWRGEARLLQLGFRGEPDKQIEFLRLEIYQPGLADHARDLWRKWTSFDGWKASDINLYTGTSDFNVGPHPAPVFMVLGVLGLAAYLLVARRKSTWIGVGLVLFFTSLALDSLWQIRLWRQVDATQSTFTDLSNDEKLALAENARAGALARRARASISDTQAKVFIASLSDAAGMEAAYYLSPLNNYWHRHGPELPDLDAIRPGNFILLVQPSAVRLNREKTLLVDGSGKQLAVIPRYEDRSGLLLEVVP